MKAKTIQTVNSALVIALLLGTVVGLVKCNQMASTSAEEVTIERSR